MPGKGRASQSRLTPQNLYRDTSLQLGLKPGFTAVWTIGRATSSC